MASWIDPLRVIVCSGAGGVGKTTMAASLGLRAARSGRKVLVITVDPARRLADAMGIKQVNESQFVGKFGRGELSAEMIEPARVFAEFVKKSSSNPAAAERLLNNRLFQQLTSTVSGSQEFTSLERLLQVSESGQYDLVILDTPPAQNATDFLRSPERIFVLFQDSVTKWFIQKGDQGFLQRAFQRSTQMAFSALEKITGKGFLTELSDFFMAAADLQEAVAARSIAVHRLLAHQQTGFMLVTAFDEAKLKEALEFASDLSSSGHFLRAVVINRARPKWLEHDTSAVGLAGLDESLQRLVEFHTHLVDYFQVREQDYTDVLKRLHRQVTTIRVPEEKRMIDGMAGLERIATYLEEGESHADHS